MEEEWFTATAQRRERAQSFTRIETQGWCGQRVDRGGLQKLPLAFETEMRRFSAMSMLTLTPTAARGNLSELLRRAVKGDDMGIAVDGKIGALRPVAVESMDYAPHEYGARVAELDPFEQRTHGQIEKARTEGKLCDLTGDIEALVKSKSPLKS